ncbi:MAG: CDP-glycerol glycerophosphotransferase family protein [Oscillospiraceae bacterium]|nr:CDP-glycerol glycerophosphotransferase family protein [Oscillospiraceae bacterium]
MIRKLRKLPLYLKYIALFVLLWFPARLLRRFHPDYRGLWLVSERGDDARDNGYWFFRYLREARPERNARYVISDESPDRPRVAALGKTVRFRSLRHHLMYLAADCLVSAHVPPAAPDMVIYLHLSHIGLRPRGRQAFIQHGIIQNDMAWMRYPNLRVDLFTCGAKPEYEFVSSRFGHPPGVVRYTGMCRYDALPAGGEHAREILIMPTWRGAFYPSGDAFPETPYYRHFQALLDDPRLSELLEELDYTLVFYPHVELQGELRHFHSPNRRVVLADKNSRDVRELLVRCALLVTDYSSVFFDVAYMRKPVIYFQFDLEDFRRYHYQEGYFSYREHGFGPVAETAEAVVDALAALASDSFEVPEPYRRRADAFFPPRDGKNCERADRAILGLEEP